MIATATFQVLDGIDKGRIYRELPLPVTIGREEGNLLRLNDERVSRFHAKVQLDDNDLILTDLESTNGTRVNGAVVQLRRLRIGDRIGVGRSLLLFGSNEEIAAQLRRQGAPESYALGSGSRSGLIEGPTLAGQDANVEFELNAADPVQPVQVTHDAIFIGSKPLPPLPQKMTASQAARFAEILDHFHHGLTQATEHVEAKDDGTQVLLNYAEWQRLMAVQMLLARYVRLIAEPE